MRGACALVPTAESAVSTVLNSCMYPKTVLPYSLLMMGISVIRRPIDANPTSSKTVVTVSANPNLITARGNKYL